MNQAHTIIASTRKWPTIGRARQSIQDTAAPALMRVIEQLSARMNRIVKSDAGTCIVRLAMRDITIDAYHLRKFRPMSCGDLEQRTHAKAARQAGDFQDGRTDGANLSHKSGERHPTGRCSDPARKPL